MSKCQNLKYFSLLLALILVLTACQAPRPAASDLDATSSPPVSGASQRTASPTQATYAPTILPSPSPQLEVTPVTQQPALPPSKQICTPLEGYSLEALLGAVNNPFHPPPAGYDDPHHGVDFADLSPEGLAQAGLPVQAVLNGRVAAVIRDRFPYGNAVLIETALEDTPTSWLEQLPTPAPTIQPQPALTCPDTSQPAWDFSSRSLYLLYAHLQEPPDLDTGETVRCGQAIGAIGDSGNALNPHLHLEARLGPAGARFNSLAHYDASATPEEMDNYCTWRVRGVFQLLDPVQILSQLP